MGNAVFPCSQFTWENLWNSTDRIIIPSDVISQSVCTCLESLYCRGWNWICQQGNVLLEKKKTVTGGGKYCIWLQKLFFLSKSSQFSFPRLIYHGFPCHPREKWFSFTYAYLKQNPRCVIYGDVNCLRGKVGLFSKSEGQQTGALGLFQLVFISHTTHNAVATTILWWSVWPGVWRVKSTCFLNVALWQVLWLPLVAVVSHCGPELLQALIMDDCLAPQIRTFPTRVLKLCLRPISWKRAYPWHCLEGQDPEAG